MSKIIKNIIILYHSIMCVRESMLFIFLLFENFSGCSFLESGGFVIELWKGKSIIF